ncbi:MAG: hypothetical protein JXA57_11065, partial [Armatimonadetes bacterium]|nr:hypothetical protein [Armatimonadota bacterium]
RYRFNAGYATGAGSVTIWATGANGYVVAEAIAVIMSSGRSTAPDNFASADVAFLLHGVRRQGGKTVTTGTINAPAGRAKPTERTSR